MDGTSFASPSVTAHLAIYISYEKIMNNASIAVDRLMKNAHHGILTYAEPNIFAYTGLKHPDKPGSCPYNGIGVDPCPDVFQGTQQTEETRKSKVPYLAAVESQMLTP